MINNQMEAKHIGETVSQIRQLVEQKRDALKELLTLKYWQIKDERVEPLDASSQHEAWDSHEIPYTWAPRDSAKTFYHKLQIPDEFMGISLIGSEVSLEFWWIIGAQIYVDGQKVYGVDYWADTQVVPIILTDALQGAATYDIVAQCKQGDGFGFFYIADMRISAIDEWVFKLDTFSEELGFVQFLIENGDAAAPALIQSALEAFESLHNEDLNNHNWNKVNAAMERVRAGLQGFEAAAKAYKIYLVGHAHIDMNWLWPWEETVELVRRDFESMVGIMNEYPEVCFSHSQASAYKLMQDKYPALFAEVMKLIDAGRWEVTAATWVEGDLNTAGYETLIRQFLEARKYAGEELGSQSEICWEPDTFGHPASLPQILVRSGVKYYYHVRAGHGVPVHWWEGVDGSRVLVFQDKRHYNGRVYASEMIEDSKSMARDYGLKSNMYVYGIGDHGGGVTRQDVRRAIRLNESPLLPVMQFSKAIDFYKDIEQHGDKLPVFIGEKNTVFEGCYTSHSDIKKANRETEHAMVRAETMSSIAAFYRNASSLDSSLTEEWRTLCFNQFHDILCGCSIHQTYIDAIPTLRQVKKTADELFLRAMNTIAARDTIDAKQALNEAESTICLTVCNTLSWDRTDIVSLLTKEHPEVRQWKTGDRLRDAAGNETVIQCTEDEIVFTAQMIPALGFKKYYYEIALNQKEAGSGELPLFKYSIMDNPVLSSKHYDLEVDKESGTIVSLLHRESQRELSYTPQSKWVEANQTKGLLNLFEMQYEAPHTMSAWKIGTITGTKRLVNGVEMTLGQQGPVMQSIHLKHEMDQSILSQEIRVYSGLDRVDFVTSVDWAEVGTGKTDAAMLKVCFRPKILAAEHTYDIPMANIQRNPDGNEAPAIHWIDVSETTAEGAFGLSLLNNAKYGHSIQGNTMMITLVRSSYEPDNSADVGQQQFIYAMYPHEFGWREANSERKALELNQPLGVVFSKEANLEQNALAHHEQFSSLRIEAWNEAGWQTCNHVIVTAFKPKQPSGEDGASWVVRLLETQGKKASIRLVVDFKVRAAEELNLLEESLQAWSGHFAENQMIIEEIKPYEIRTFLITK